jgi:hypothetical protein
MQSRHPPESHPEEQSQYRHHRDGICIGRRFHASPLRPDGRSLPELSDNTDLHLQRLLKKVSQFAYQSQYAVPIFYHLRVRRLFFQVGDYRIDLVGNILTVSIQNGRSKGIPRLFDLKTCRIRYSLQPFMVSLYKHLQVYMRTSMVLQWLHHFR